MNKLFQYICLIFGTTLYALQSYAVTYTEAVKSYADKKYTVAYSQFYELAGLGNKDAQYALAMMYLDGHGTAENTFKSYAWLALSAEEGKKKYVNVLSEFEKLLSDDQKAKAEEQLAILAQDYSNDALVEKIYPIGVEVVASDPGKFPHIPVRKIAAKYPRQALNRGLFGSTTVEYIVAADGRTKYPRISSSTDSVFNKSAIEATLNFLYKPAKIDDKNVDTFSVRNRFHYEINGSSIKSSKVANYLVDLRSAATNGDAKTRYQYSIHRNVLQSYLSDADKSRFADDQDFMLLAAKDGFGLAKYSIGKRVFYGNSCEVDRPKGIFWLSNAASNGDAKSSLLLGLSYLNGAYLPRNEVQALRWLAEAAALNDEGKIEYSVALVTVGDDDLRNLDLAKETIAMVNRKKVVDKLSFFEAEAIVSKASGDLKSFERSIKSIKKEAKKRGLNYEIFVKNIDHRIAGRSIESLVAKL